MDDERSGNEARRSPIVLLVALGVLVVAAFAVALALGATVVSPFALLAPSDPTHATILLEIRLPRAMLAAVVGAILAASGAAMQGVLRNPLADPGLCGVSSGASFGAVVAIVALSPLVPSFSASARPFVVPAFAFGAALLVSFGILRVATRFGRTSIFVLLLAGIAINAFVGAAIGLLSYFASDAQLRDILFWMMGSLDRASFREVAMTGVPAVFTLVALVGVARDLDLLALGEREARHLGVEVDGVYRRVLALVALGVGAAVATTGLVGFVGLVVPHLMRIVVGPRHRLLLGASALFGAALTLVADTISRTLVPPHELPIGVVTALVGAPVFLSMLVRQTGRGVAS